MSELTNTIILKITDDAAAVMKDIQEIIEYGYAADENLIVDYTDFWVQIYEICTPIGCYPISEVNSDIAIVLSNSKEFLMFQARIHCQEAICDHMVKKYNRHSLESLCTEKLQIYFERNLNSPSNLNANTNSDDPAFKFTVVTGMEEYFLLHPPQPESDSSPVLLISVFTFMGIMFILSFMAWLHNQESLCFVFPGSTPVDNAAWMACAVFSVQVWDFVSDINLSIEILTTGELSNPLILLAGLGSLLFILIPYIANLIIAGRIRHFIRKNDAAKAWFNDYSSLFVLFVVSSGGCHPALSLVSSNIFGLRLFASGLTLYELRQLTKIKVIGTILLENVPQLFCQFLYVYATGN